MAILLCSIGHAEQILNTPFFFIAPLCFLPLSLSSFSRWVQSENFHQWWYWRNQNCSQECSYLSLMFGSTLSETAYWIIRWECRPLSPPLCLPLWPPDGYRALWSRQVRKRRDGFWGGEYWQDWNGGNTEWVWLKMPQQADGQSGRYSWLFIWIIYFWTNWISTEDDDYIKIDHVSKFIN